MIWRRQPAAWMAALILCLLVAPALGQDEAIPANVQAALKALRDTPAADRSRNRQDVVELGDVAVGGLLAAVQQHRQADDVNYVMQCMLALGDLKAEPATEAIIDALSSNEIQLVYAAAHTLGNIWEGRGASDEAVKQVNAALFGALFSEISGAAVYGPALALVKVNAIPITRPESMDPDELQSEVADWLAQHPDAVAPVDQQPWQLNVYTLATSSDAQALQDAVQALRQKRLLAPIENIQWLLLSGLPDDLAGELAQLLGELSGMPFPPEGADPSLSLAEQVLTWRWLWLEHLKAQTDEKHVAYTWDELERGLRVYAESPDEDAAQRVGYYRAALLYQLADPRGIPTSASKRARDLMSSPLAAKKQIADSTAAFSEAQGDYGRQAELKRIEEQVSNKHGREVGVQFLGQIAALARTEQSVNLARQIGGILSLITGIPCDLDYTAAEKRTEQLDRWVEKVRELGLVAEEPAQ